MNDIPVVNGDNEQSERINDGPPNYWRNETAGYLAPAIMRYLNNLPLSDHDISLIRVYFRQWVDSPVWDQNPHGVIPQLAALRASAREIRDRAAIDVWLMAAVAAGMDPL